ncbi:hypothetical protein ACP275_01G071500 [Erythranthe tilingii]
MSSIAVEKKSSIAAHKCRFLIRHTSVDSFQKFRHNSVNLEVELRVWRWRRRFPVGQAEGGEQIRKRRLKKRDLHQFWKKKSQPTACGRHLAQILAFCFCHPPLNFVGSQNSTIFLLSSAYCSPSPRSRSPLLHLIDLHPIFPNLILINHHLRLCSSNVKDPNLISVLLWIYEQNMI